MYVVIYQFNVKPQQAETFIKAWEGLTELIYKHEGSLGSRLHKQDEQTYIAYAQWPDKTTFKNSGNNLPGSTDEVRKAMREACESIKTLHELEMVKDLLRG